MRPQARAALAAAAFAATVFGVVSIAGAADPPTSYVFVARGDNPADALAASSLAGRLDAPIVLVRSDDLPAAAAAAIVRADPAVVFIAGGEGAVNADVQAQIAQAVPDAMIERLAGADRFETASEVAKRFPDLPPAFLASDGTAMAAESANTFGGLAPDEYRLIEGTASQPGGFDGHPLLDGSYGGMTVTEVEFTAPSDGVILAGGSLFTCANDVPQDLTARVVLDRPKPYDESNTDHVLALANGVVASDSQAFRTLEAPGDTPVNFPFCDTLDMTGAFPVTAGPHRVTLTLSGKLGEVGISNERLWVDFSPNGTVTVEEITPP